MATKVGPVYVQDSPNGLQTVAFVRSLNRKIGCEVDDEEEDETVAVLGLEEEEPDGTF
jgi:hypothetical protein